LNSQIGNVLPLGDITKAIPRNPTTELNTGDSDEIEIQRLKHSDNIGGDVRRTQDIIRSLVDTSP
jgi:hypothetical protein